MKEHDFEPIRGLPGDLPAGERLVWQGAPDWWALAQRALHVRSVSIYFAALMLWRGAAAALAGADAGAAAASALQVVPLALVAIGLLCAIAVITARTTVYTITSKRVVLRFGVALPKAINIPFTIIDSAALKTFGDGTGDVALTLTEPNKIAYFLLWPHARPWKLARPQPAFRAVAAGALVAGHLAQALKGSHPHAPSPVVHPTGAEPTPAGSPEFSPA